MQTLKPILRRWQRASTWLAALSLASACGSAGSTSSSDDATADDVPSDALADGGDAAPGDTTTANDTLSGAQLVIDSPKANATLSGAGAFQLQAHVVHPPTTGGPFAVKVADAVSAYVVATATTDDLAKPIDVEVNLAGLAGGGYALRVSVLDAKASLVATADLAFTVNAPPTAPVVAIDPAQPTAADGFSAKLTTPSTDPEGDAVTYTYAWTRNGVATADSGSSIAASATKKGEVWVVAVTPADSYGKGWPGYAQVLVGNEAPVAATLASDATLVDVVGDVSATVATAASDPDGDAIQLTWKWQVNGTAVPGKNVAKTTVPALGAALGTTLKVGDSITLVQVVTDGLATTTSKPLTWTVADVAPHLFIDAPTANSVQSSAGSFTLAGHVENPPTTGGPFSVKVADAVSGFVVATGSVDSLTAPFTTQVNVAGVPAGTYAVVVSLATAAGTSVASADLQFTVNAPPAPPVVLIVPATPTAADSLTVQIATPSVDPEGDAVTYTYAWTKDGAATNQTAATVPEGVVKKNEVWVVTVTPADAYGKGWAGSAYVVIGNQAPIAATLAQTATQLDLEGDASATTAVSAGDPDGDALLLTWQWSLNGVALPGLNQPHAWASELAAAAGKPLVVGDQVTLVQTAFDGLATATSTALTWQVADFLPHLFIDSPAQNSVLTSGAPFSLTAHVENPPAGGPFVLTVADAVSGTIVAQKTVESLVELSILVDVGGIPDGTYDLKVSVTNAAQAPVASRDLLFSANAPPTQPQVAVTPQLPTAQDSLTVNLVVAASDPEGDAVSYTYAWLRNGQPTSYTDATVPEGAAKKGEIWTAVVTASDGYGTSWPASANVQIGNLAPVAPVLAADVQVVGLLGDVSASTAQAATDADGDPLLVAWHWAVNGTPVPAKTSAATTVFSLRTALGATIKAGDVITVAATADDGTAVALSNELTWTVQGGADVCASRPVCGISAVCANNDSLDPTCTCVPTTIGDGQYCVLVTGLSPTASTFVVSDGTTNFTVGGNANVPGLVVVEVLDPLTGNVLSTTSIPSLGGASAITAKSPITGTGNVTVRITHLGVKLGERTYAIALNHKATAPAGGFNPAAPNTTQAVAFAQTATSTDVDAGQTITYKYAWSVNNVVNAAQTTTTFPAATAKKGDKLTLKVTPNDGVENGAALTLNVTIADAPPTAFAGVYTNLTPNTLSTVGVTLTNPPTTDVDGDPVTYTYAWFANNQLAAGATTASVDLSGAGLKAGDVVHAEVTASDGTLTTKLVLPGLTLVAAP